MPSPREVAWKRLALPAGKKEADGQASRWQGELSEAGLHPWSPAFIWGT